MVKKVAFTQLSARTCNTWLLLRGNGPSSKVSTTSWSRSGNVSAYCMVPIRGCSRGSTTRVREVPSASGWPGQSAADAICAVMQVSTPKHKAAHCRVRTPINTLPIMKHRLHSHLRKSYRRGDEHRINRMTSPDDVHDVELTARRHSRRRQLPAPHGPRESDCRGDNAERPAAWPRFAPWG